MKRNEGKVLEIDEDYIQDVLQIWEKFTTSPNLQHLNMGLRARVAGYLTIATAMGLRQTHEVARKRWDETAVASCSGGCGESFWREPYPKNCPQCGAEVVSRIKSEEEEEDPDGDDR